MGNKKNKLGEVVEITNLSSEQECTKDELREAEIKAIKAKKRADATEAKLKLMELEPDANAEEIRQLAIKAVKARRAADNAESKRKLIALGGVTAPKKKVAGVVVGGEVNSKFDEYMEKINTELKEMIEEREKGKCEENSLVLQQQMEYLLKLREQEKKELERIMTELACVQNEVDTVKQVAEVYSKQREGEEGAALDKKHVAREKELLDNNREVVDVPAAPPVAVTTEADSLNKDARDALVAQMREIASRLED